MDRAEFIEALHLIEKEKGIDKEIIFEAIEASLVSACKKNFGSNQNIKVVIDRETGTLPATHSAKLWKKSWTNRTKST